MPLPVGAVIEASIRGEIYGQTVLNIWHYRVSTPSNIVAISDEVTTFRNSWSVQGVGSFFNRYLACVPSTMVVTRITAQAISPLRYVRQAQVTSLAGTGNFSAVTNLQGSITFQTIFAGRGQIGGKRIPIGDQDALAGKLSGDARDRFLDFATNCIAPVTASQGNGVYVPVIYRRNVQGGISERINAAIVQDTIRVMRRRTVGLGE
jgi:hypothetical protein